MPNIIVVDANVVVQLENLREHPSVAAALKINHTDLHGWVYDFVNGHVRAYNEAKREFAPL